jgi:RNA polymerase primary sigma factor
MIARLLSFQAREKSDRHLLPERPFGCCAQKAPVTFSAHGRRALPTGTKREVYRYHRRGESVAALAQRDDLSRSHAYHVINDPDVARIMELPLDHVGNEEFARLCYEKKDREILRALPESDRPTRKPRVPDGLPAYLASLYDVPLLTREQESRLFRKMNYLKYKASVLRAQLGLSRSTSRLIRQIGELYDESAAIKTQIVCANLRLVVSIAKRYVRPMQDFFELVSDGNMSLLRAVDKFDFSRGNKFSTYATWAIMRNFGRAFQVVARYRDRFPTSYPEMFDETEDVRADQYKQESAHIQRELQVESILSRLDERERQIVTARFGLTRSREPLTLTQVGAAMGVTKERIRQIQRRAMDKLRAAARESAVECMA